MAGSPTLSRADLHRLSAAGIHDANDARKLVRVLRRLIHSAANQRALSEFIDEAGRQPTVAHHGITEQAHQPTLLQPNEIPAHRGKRPRFGKLDHGPPKERRS
jgi:hypothetical protein